MNGVSWPLRFMRGMVTLILTHNSDNKHKIKYSNMYTCVCMYVYIYIYTCIHTYIFIYIYTKRSIGSYFENRFLFFVPKFKKVCIIFRHWQ